MSVCQQTLCIQVSGKLAWSLPKNKEAIYFEPMSGQVRNQIGRLVPATLPGIVKYIEKCLIELHNSVLEFRNINECLYALLYVTLCVYCGELTLYSNEIAF